MQKLIASFPRQLEIYSRLREQIGSRLINLRAREAMNFAVCQVPALNPAAQFSVHRHPILRRTHANANSCRS